MASMVDQTDLGQLGGYQAPAQEDWFSSNAPPPAPAAVSPQAEYDNFKANYWAPDRDQVLAQKQQALGSGGQNFGNLSDPRQWDALVADDTKLRAWIKSNNPGWSDQLVNYYAGVIKKQPGANDAEKAGSAQYYINQKFKQDPFYGGSGGSGGGNLGLGHFGSLAQGWDKQFTAPSVDEIRATPGYQFALNEGVKALDTSAAAQGTVLSGGQKKDILQYATGLADQTAQQKYQNALGEYMNSYNIFRNNGNDIFNRFNTLAGAGTSAAGAATS